jgi:hypothetical protein
LQNFLNCAVAKLKYWFVPFQQVVAVEQAAMPGLHDPAQQIPESQMVLSLLAIYEQDFVVSLQLSLVQSLLSLQTTAPPTVQVPAWQVSDPLQ